MSKSVTVSALTHDLVGKKSFVVLIWDDDPTKRVSLPVTFGCSLDAIRNEAEQAMRELSAETSQIAVNLST